MGCVGAGAVLTHAVNLAQALGIEVTLVRVTPHLETSTGYTEFQRLKGAHGLHNPS